MYLDISVFQPYFEILITRRESRDTDLGSGETQRFWRTLRRVERGFRPRPGNTHMSWPLQDSRDTDSGPGATPLGGVTCRFFDGGGT